MVDNEKSWHMAIKGLGLVTTPCEPQTFSCDTPLTHHSPLTKLSDRKVNGRVAKCPYDSPAAVGV